MQKVMGKSRKLQISEAEVRAVPTPEWTRTWHPVPHGMVLDALEDSVNNMGIGIRGMDYALTANGNNMFGNWELDISDNGAYMTMGFRNSLNKLFSFGIAVGYLITNCTNLCLSGDFVQKMKHTRGLDKYTLQRMTDHSTEDLVPRLNGFSDFMKALKGREVSDTRRKALTYNLMDNGAFPPSQFKQFNDAWVEERDTHGNNLYALHGAGTRIMRDASLFKVSDRSMALNNTLKYHELMGRDWH